MKKLTLLVLALLTGALTASSAFAWGGRSHVFVGFNFGFPAYYPAPYYYYPPAYYPAPVVVQQQPQVYVEQPAAPAAAPAQSENYWYYCAGSRTYYPYVKDCPGGWQRVSPTPQG
jgi:hypothetical protein